MTYSYSFGEHHYSPGPRPSDDNNLRGAGWTASRIDDGYTLSFPAAAQGGREITLAISQEEFERLRDDPTAFQEIALKHDPDPP